MFLNKIMTKSNFQIKLVMKTRFIYLKKLGLILRLHQKSVQFYQFIAFLGSVDYRTDTKTDKLI